MNKIFFEFSKEEKLSKLKNFTFKAPILNTEETVVEKTSNKRKITPPRLNKKKSRLYSKTISKSRFLRRARYSIKNPNSTIISEPY